MSELKLDKQKKQLVNALLIKKFTSLGFNKLTEIQKKAIPKILEQKNSLIIAPTGSGKTECSVIPIFSQIKKTKSPGKIKILYITPLRALNRDVFRRIITYGEIEDLDIKIRHGDTTQANRRKIRDSPPDILITTPETLQIMLSGKRLRKNLSGIKAVIIDEVHELASSERGAQLSIALERLVLLAGEFHRIGLSATVGTPKEVSLFLVGDRDVEILTPKLERNMDLLVHAPEPVSDDDELMLISDKGMLVRTRVAEVNIIGRNTQGVRIIKLSGDEKVVSAIKIDDNLK